MEIQFRCPHCNAVLPRTVSELRADPDVICAECGAELSIWIDPKSLDAAADASFKEMLDAGENALW
jgi:lysine biosynthesis protein LysW